MQQTKPGSPIKKMVAGALGRCPNCEEGHILQGWATLKKTCPVCHVRFERQPGEGTGAMMIVLSLIPLPTLLLFIWLYSLKTIELPILMVGLIVFIVVESLIAFRPARGIWLSIIYLNNGLFTDEEKPYQA